MIRNNAFYYRFLESGSPPTKKGPWSKKEKGPFLKRLEEFGAKQWGVFSKPIEGRVGYQCRNFYKTYISTIVPPNVPVPTLLSEENIINKRTGFLDNVPVEKVEDFAWIYCMSHPNYFERRHEVFVPLLKIGITTKDPHERARQLFATGVPNPFQLVFARWVFYSRHKEKKLHAILGKYRSNNSREFFAMSEKVCRDHFELFDGEWYKGIECKIICENTLVLPSGKRR